MLNPFAYFDCLGVATKLQGPLGGASTNELHLFSYLACLLSLYRRQPVAEWGYQFAGTKQGLPFSPEIESVSTELVNHQSMTRQNGFFILTEQGHQQYSMLSSLSLNKAREPYLAGACSSVLALPVAIVRDGLRNGTELKAAGDLSSKRMLLDRDGPGLEIVYEQFGALSKAIGVDVSDLMIPAVMWLSYLTSESATVATVDLGNRE